MGNVYMRQFTATFDVRDFDMEGDGRTVLARVVPYGETISFVDPYDGGKVKRERFVPGALAKQSSPGAWSRVLLSFQHEDGFDNTIGYGREIQDREDGAYATFRLYAADADKAREMMTSSHKGVSLEFEVRGGRERLDPEGVILRDNVRARRVGITNDPAFTGAKVLALRESSVDLRAPDEPDAVDTPHLDVIRAELAQLRGRWTQ